jgi:hypothetical protein
MHDYLLVPFVQQRQRYGSSFEMLRASLASHLAHVGAF